MGLMKEPATLSLVAGKSWLSLWEATHLAVGDVVRSSTICGRPHALTLNDRYLCAAETVVLNERFGVRLCGFGAEAVAPDRPAVDDVLDLLPVELRLPPCRSYCLADLDGLVPGSIVELSAPYREDEDGELVVAGMVVAAGKFVVVGETFGLRITRLHAVEATEAPVRVSFNRLEGPALPAMKIKDYNWKRPDKFSREAVMRLGRIHELFLENAPFYHPAFAGWKVGTVDQCTFSEEAERLAACDRIGVVKVSGMHRERRVRPESARPAKWFLKPADSPNPPLPKAFVDYVEGKSPFPGNLESDALLVAARSTLAVASSISTEAPDRLLAPLRNGWKNISAADFRLDRVETAASKAKIVPDNDMIISVTLEGPGGGDERMLLLYPYIMLEPFLPYLD
ncbi:MAG: FliM/FliN family flagellar motor switch protein [Spirochaetes bacterium]|nr:FliM/FliN family flagellar motor switch protein [Spirochaetota bacterium]